MAVVEGWPLREVPLYVIRLLLLTIGVPISLKRAPSRIGTYSIFTYGKMKAIAILTAVLKLCSIYMYVPVWEPHFV